jgi:hypothetical protein
MDQLLAGGAERFDGHLAPVQAELLARSEEVGDAAVGHGFLPQRRGHTQARRIAASDRFVLLGDVQRARLGIGEPASRIPLWMLSDSPSLRPYAGPEESREAVTGVDPVPVVKRRGRAMLIR